MPFPLEMKDMGNMHSMIFDIQVQWSILSQEYPAQKKQKSILSIAFIYPI